MEEVIFCGCLFYFVFIVAKGVPFGTFVLNKNSYYSFKSNSFNLYINPFKASQNALKIGYRVF